MSSDDYILIVKMGRKYNGYRLYVSAERDVVDVMRDDKPYFTVTGLRKAIFAAQAIPTEYGYTYMEADD